MHCVMMCHDSLCVNRRKFWERTKNIIHETIQNIAASSSWNNIFSGFYEYVLANLTVTFILFQRRTWMKLFKQDLAVDHVAIREKKTKSPCHCSCAKLITWFATARRASVRSITEFWIGKFCHSVLNLHYLRFAPPTTFFQVAGLPKETLSS